MRAENIVIPEFPVPIRILRASRKRIAARKRAIKKAALMKKKPTKRVA